MKRRGPGQGLRVRDEHLGEDSLGQTPWKRAVAEPRSDPPPCSTPQAMESKLLIGGRTIVDHTNEQQKMLELKRQEIAEQVMAWGPHLA